MACKNCAKLKKEIVELKKELREVEGIALEHASMLDASPETNPFMD